MVLISGKKMQSVREQIENLSPDALQKLADSLAASPATASPIRGVRPAHLPLSFAQERLWLVEQMEPVGSTYNLRMALRLVGRLDENALSRSFTELVRRHEILRTRIDVLNGNAVQIIEGPGCFSLRKLELDTNGLPLELAAQRLLLSEADRPFDLGRQLFRVCLLQLSVSEHVLLIIMHHSISDGWSFDILGKELKALYRDYADNVPSQLPELELQYADYAVWQRQALQGEALDRQLSYWRRALPGTSAPLDLPTDRPRPTTPTFKGSRHSFYVAQELADALTELCHRAQMTLHMLLLATLQVVLSRWSGQSDVAVGTPIAGRVHPKLECLVGFFVNMLVMRTDLSGNPTFAELLQRVRRVALGAYEHQELPFEKLVAELQPERDPSRQVLFQVTLVLQNGPGSQWQSEAFRSSDIGELQWNLWELELTSVPFDQCWYVFQASDGLECRIEFAVDLFDAATIERLAESFQQVLAAVVVDAERPISELPLLGQEQRDQLLVQWNATQRDYPHDRCIHELFEEQVRRAPDAVAVVFGERRLSYRELDDQSNRLAHYLRERDIGPEGVVGLCMERGVDLVVGILGVLKAGGAYLPLDPRYPAERLGFMLEDSRARLLIGDAESRSVLSHITSVAAALIPVLYLPDLAERLIDYPSGALPSLSTADTLAYVIYTSGSTGRPKAVGAGHRSVLHRVSAQEQITPLGIDEVFCQKTAIGFVDAVAEMWVPLLKGQRLVIASRSVGEDVRLLSELIEEAGVTWLVAVPSLAKAWVGDAQSVGRLKGLRHWTLSGEALSPELLGQLKEALPSCRFVNLYGCSEVAADATCYVSGEDEREQERVPIGRPLANMQVYVLDEYLEPVPVGVAGEIYVGGVGVARGYVGQAALTAERFIANPFGEAGKRLYRTGDRARHLPNGQLQYLGRLDEQVKIRGFRIELGEIEAQLRKHKQVKEAVVIVRENQPGEQHLIGYVEPRGDDRPSAEELHMYLRSMLPEYMVPAVFVVLEHLPLTASGKVDRQSLPAPDMTAQLHAQYVSFSTPTEEVLVQIWAEVLQLEQVGVLDNFFELGGHSLLATQVMARVRESFAVELPLRTMFEASVTVRELAEKIDRSRREEQGLKLPELVARPVGMERIPLSFAQERLWFLEQLQDLGGMHNEMLPMHLEGALDVDALRRSFEELVRRHENLRTRIVTTEEGRGIQLIDPPGLFKWRVIDLSELSRQARDAEQRRLIQAEAQDSFDLTESLFRVSLLRLESDSHVLLVTLHHIISDVWSLLGVLQRELNTLYAAYSEGHPSPLAELSVQYADYALWQRSWLQGDVLQGQLEYWKQQLADMPAALELPTDRPRPPKASYKGDRHYFYISQAQLDMLKTLARREGATLYMVLLAAFQLVLSRWSGQRDVVVGSPIAGRIHRKTEGLIGLFLNNLVMRTELSGDPSFKELLVRVKEVALGAYAHQDIPFERLVAELEPQRDLSRQALFQVVLVLQNQPLTELELPKLALRIAQIEHVTSKFDMWMGFFESPEGLIGHAEYATDLFDAATIERLAESFQQVLAAVVVDAERPISELPLLGQEQRDQLLVQWNATQRDYPHDRCIHELFEEQVRRAPDAVAVVFGERRLSYRELDDQSNRLAHYLRERDIGPEGVVGLCMERGVDLVVGILGVLKAGGAYLPLDPRYPAERLGFMLEDSRARLLIGDAESRSVLSHITSVAAALIPVLYLPDLAERLIDYPSGALPSLSTADTLAYVIYTSGSTGRPKAVGAGHRSVLHRVSAQEQITPLGIDEVFCQKTAIGFVDAVAEMWVPLLKGQRLVIASRSVGEDVRLLSELIEEAGVTWLVAVPSLAKAWVGDAQSVGRLKGLRHWTLSGEALSPELLGQLKEALPSCRFVNLYGCSEVAADATCYVSGEDEREQERVPIGRPLANMQVYVLDEYLEPVPVGVAGEIYVGGVGVARGYVGQAALTAERFIANPFGEAGKRLYRTGDRARHLPNGQLQYLGRLDEQVKIRGFRIELGEIEAQLRKHKQVKEAVVIVRENQPGEQHLIGYVEPRGDDRPSAEELHMYLRSMLPEYMVPAVFVVLEHLPLTASGKIARTAFHEHALSGYANRQYEAPQGEIEEALAEVWKDLLGAKQVGRRDNFFELGGHSLVAIRVITRVNQLIDVDLPLHILFETPTIAEIAHSIIQGIAAEVWETE